MPVTTMPGMVVATDRETEYDFEGLDKELLQAIAEEPIFLSSKRYSGGKGAKGRYITTLG